MSLPHNVAHALLATMQAALVEWHYGQGADASLKFIANCLRDHDLLPRFLDAQGTSQIVDAPPEPPIIERRLVLRAPAKMRPLIVATDIAATLPDAPAAQQRPIEGIAPAPRLLRLAEVEARVRTSTTAEVADSRRSGQRNDSDDELQRHAEEARAAAPDRPYRLMRAQEVLDRMKFGRTALYRYIKEGKLPRPIKMVGTSFWIESEVDAVIVKLMAERDRAHAKAGVDA